MKKIIAVASYGGHWVQLLKILPSFKHNNYVLYTTRLEDIKSIDRNDIKFVTDFSISSFWKLPICIAEALIAVYKEKPDIIISTGAAPGLCFIIAGKILARRTIWIDSIANCEKLSLSGRVAKHIASITVTQWCHLAKTGGPVYLGRIL